MQWIDACFGIEAPEIFPCPGGDYNALIQRWNCFKTEKLGPPAECMHQIDRFYRIRQKGHQFVKEPAVAAKNDSPGIFIDDAGNKACGNRQKIFEQWPYRKTSCTSPELVKKFPVP
ncbi:hypothetical protein [Geobacter sp. SVR]|uniref:hypothetical protein n=1 Tax=Geobacter sp. SVR TaxID=2495594 RepID=UPI00156581A0|nr:hypothetical protein [Geobacter sp. SVR]